MSTSSSKSKSRYPGVDLPLRYLQQSGHAGIDFYRYGSFDGAKDTLSELLQVREVAMMILMDRLTDKTNWHEKVFNDEIVAKWREEALTQNEQAIYLEILAEQKLADIPMPKRTRIINQACFDYCIAELKCKAAYFKETGMIFTSNAGHNQAVKSDCLVSHELHQSLKASFKKLRADQASDPDWHPWTDEKVMDLVHPSMYPFVYGKTKFVMDEVVGLADAVEKWSGKGDVVPNEEVSPPPDALYRSHERYQNGGYIDQTYWSKNYQWLPANMAFQEDGTVCFTSYINNLHPKKYPEIYGLVEKLVNTAIPVWDRVLSGRAVYDSNDQVRFGAPPDVFEDECDDVWEAFSPDVITAYEAKEGPIEYDADYLEDFDVELHGDMTEEEVKEAQAPAVAKLKWKEIRDPILLDPKMFEPVAYKVEQNLREKFKDSGLQVIVKMASIELTPEKPDFPAGGWHIEGQMNEHIVATALFYLDSENVTSSSLSFRMATEQQQDDLQEQVGQDLYHVYERIFGMPMGGGNGQNVQTYGSVETKEGRLLAFPNVFQHRVSPFTLQDPTKPGHRRFIALWLVDPHQRIISTANVPPQQFNWWAEAVFGGFKEKAATGDMPPELVNLLLEQGAAKTIRPTDKMLKKLGNRLPAEVMEMVRREGVVPNLGLMTEEEAKEHRLRLMDERSAFVEKAEGEWRQGYSFCEH